MVVTGTQQRVYGTLTGGCIIDLNRFLFMRGVMDPIGDYVYLGVPPNYETNYNPTNILMYGYRGYGDKTYIFDNADPLGRFTGIVYVETKVRQITAGANITDIWVYAENIASPNGSYPRIFVKSSEFTPTYTYVGSTFSCTVNDDSLHTGEYRAWDAIEGLDRTYLDCGYKYSGYMSLLFTEYSEESGSNEIQGVVEIRICKQDPNRIVLETYGITAPSDVDEVGILFNKGSRDKPDWVVLNTTQMGIVMPKLEISYKFKESKSKDTVEIGCCKKCPACKCIRCNIANRLCPVSSKFPSREWAEEYIYDWLAVPSHNNNLFNIKSEYGVWTYDTRAEYDYPLNPYMRHKTSDETAGTETYTYLSVDAESYPYTASYYAYVEVSYSCDEIKLYFGSLGSEGAGLDSVIMMYLNDDDVWTSIGFYYLDDGYNTEEINTFPFDYLKNCTNLQWSKICGAYIIMHDSIGNILDANNSNCFTGKTITFSSGLCFDSVTATIIGTASPNILIIDPSTITGVYNPSYFTPDYSLTISYNSTGYSGSNTISDISTVFTIDSGNSGCLIENLPYLDRYMSSVSDYGKYTLHYDYDVSISISGSSQVEPVSLRLTIERHVAKWIPDLYVSEVHTDIDTVYSDTTHWIGSISTELYRYYGTTTDFAPTNQMRLNISVRGSSGGSSYDDVTITLNYNVTNVYLTDCKGNIVPSGQNTLPSYPYISTPFTVS